MSGLPDRLPADSSPSDDGVTALLAGLDDLDLDRFTIVGRYARFDADLRAKLDEFRQQLMSTFALPGGRPQNFLLWGPPGSGKSYLVQESVKALPEDVRFEELNLSRLAEQEFRARIQLVWESRSPVLYFIDEVDAQPDATWPYELLLSYLDPPVARPAATGFVLAGSGGASPAEMRRAIQTRPKGGDLLSRVPVANDFEVRPLGAGDRILVAAVQFLEAARLAGHPLRDIEKFALFFAASNPAYSSARQLRALADQTAQRIPVGETRLRYDHLFRPGDPENKEFWSLTSRSSSGLIGAYVRVRPTPTDVPARTKTPRPEPPMGPRSSGRPSSTRVAVLPFRNISPDPADSYLADGFTEEITSTLAGIPGLEIVPRASASRYLSRGDKSAEEIASELNAGSLLDGSVRKAGTRVRITAQFVDAALDRHAWAETFEGDVSDLFKLQTEIASRVAGALQSGVGGAGTSTSRRPPTPSMDAYLLFLKGRAAYREATLEALERAIALYERALEADPRYADALAGVASAYRRIGFWLYRPSAEAIAKAREYAERALAIDPTLVDAHLTVAMLLRVVDHDFPSAEREIRAILKDHPRNGYVHAVLANSLVEAGRLEDVRREAYLALELNPESSETAQWAGDALLYAGRPSEAAGILRRALQLEPEDTSTRHNLGLTLVQCGLYAEGVALMEEALTRTATPSPIQFMELGYGLLRAGHRERAIEFLERIASQAASIPAYWGAAAGIYANLGQLDDAFSALESALDAHAPFLVTHLRTDFIFDPLRGDPRFANALRRVGADPSAYQKKAPHPDGQERRNRTDSQVRPAALPSD